MRITEKREGRREVVQEEARHKQHALVGDRRGVLPNQGGIK